jgi:hypothetical protein
VYNQFTYPVIRVQECCVTIKKIFALLALMTVSTFALGQAISTSGGAIQGSITDPSGAVVPGAMVVITSPETGYTHTITSDKSGFYSIGPLVPGTYVISVTAPNFEALKSTTTVRIGTVTSGNEKLTLGKSTETVEVTTGVLQVNTDQIGVAGVVTREQIDSIPVNGRNILDIAQIQPGVILQDGQNFDPTKAGYEAISTGGVSGRTTRILLDGQDITDETVGTTIFNVPSGAVDEFQLNRSTQDVSGEVTSTGQVLLSTQSGSNSLHGNAFYNFQNNTIGYAPVDAQPASPFQRNQMGGYVGGPIIKDKLFFFAGLEHILQHSLTPAQGDSLFGVQPAGQPSQIAGDPYLSAPIFSLYPTTPSPFHDTYSTARVDYNGPKGIHIFGRISYSVNYDDANFGLTPYAIYTNRDNVPAYAGGADLTTGNFTHSFRAGYEKFHNILVDGTASLGSSIYNPSTGPTNQISLVGDLNAGPNYLAPQGTFQSEKQFRYDGTWTKGKNNVKFGFAMSRILGGGFAAFYGSSLYTVLSATPGYEALSGYCNDQPNLDPNSCPGDPTHGYISAEYVLGNGNGLFSERPAFGLPGGGSPSWRFSSYIGDTYKVSPSVTMVAGLRWSVDTDRANQDLPTPLCSSVDPAFQFAGCTGNTPLFDQYGSTTGSGTLGSKTHQPYANFGPQLGIVVSPGSHKLSVRAGIGVYYDSDIFNNTGNARPESVQTPGAYFNYGYVQPGQGSIYLPGYGSVSSISGTSGAPCTTPGVGGCVTLASVLLEPIAEAAPLINGLKSAYQGVVKGVVSANPSYIGTGDALYADSIYAGPYKSPYSIQYNGGVQYEIKKGTIFSADYIHNSTLKVPLTIDVNRIGAASTYNNTAAQNAVNNATASLGCAGGHTAAAINCAIANNVAQNIANGNGSIDTFLSTLSQNGLDSSAVAFGGPYPASALGLTPNTGAAFAGVNANVGGGDFILPVGRSGYDALQIVLQQQKSHPAPGILDSNFQASYSLSRVVSTASGSQDQLFAGAHPLDNDAPTKYIGRNEIDHSNEVSFGGSATFGVQRFNAIKMNVGFTGHFFSAPPTTLSLDANNANTQTAGQIYQTDLDGDGSTGDILPGTSVGAYMHQVKTTTGLNNLIKTYNQTHAGTLTPAGQQLLNSGLFTQTQLTAIGAVQNPIASAPQTLFPNAAFRTFDVSAGIPVPFLNHIRKGLSIVPTVAAYNVFNMSNFGGLSGVLLNSGDSSGTGNICAPTSTNCSGILNTGHLNGPNNVAIANTYRTQRGAGVFDQGAPRTIEFQLKINY